MADIDLRPQVVNILAYAGNTVPLTIVVPAGVADNFIWSGQLKATRDSDVVDAEFVITEPASPGEPAYAMLSAVDTARLAGVAPMIRKRSVAGVTMEVRSYSGEYDIQAKHPMDPDPVYTWVQGTLTIDLDVTRVI